jgi:hypothetical protein
MIKMIKEAIGIRTNGRREEFIPTFKTTNPQERLSFNEWCITFKVGSCYGKDVKYFG